MKRVRWTAPLVWDVVGAVIGLLAVAAGLIFLLGEGPALADAGREAMTFGSDFYTEAHSLLNEIDSRLYSLLLAVEALKKCVGCGLFFFGAREVIKYGKALTAEFSAEWEEVPVKKKEKAKK